MRVVHVLRKYNPAEWGGTETALQRLFDGFRPNGIIPIVYCPRIAGTPCDEVGTDRGSPNRSASDNTEASGEERTRLLVPPRCGSETRGPVEFVPDPASQDPLT